MGHVVNPVAFRLNFSKYWLNLHSEKKNSNYLNFSDYVLLISLKRLLKKRIFFRFKLVFDKLVFIHRLWQELLIIKFKYSKYKILKKSKKKVIRNKLKKKTLNLKKESWKASRSYYGMFARIKLRIALFTCFDFFKKPNFSNYLSYVKKPFSIKESSYHKLVFMFSSKFFRWYDKPLFAYKFSDYFFKFIIFKKNLKIFLKKKKLVSNFTIKNFKKISLIKFLKKNSLKNYSFFFNKLSSGDSAIYSNRKHGSLIDFNFFKFHYAKPRFFNYSKKSFKLFCSSYWKYYDSINSALFRQNHSSLRSSRISTVFWLRKIGKINKKINFFEEVDEEEKFTKNLPPRQKPHFLKSPEILFKKNKFAKKHWLKFKILKNFSKIQKKDQKNNNRRFDNSNKKVNVKKLPNVFEKTLKTLKNRRLIFFNIFNYNAKKTKKFNYKKFILRKQFIKKTDNHSMEYVIFYKSLKESLDLIFSGKKLLKKNRGALLSYFINMPIWDKLLKKHSKKRKDLFWKLGKLPFKLTRLKRRKNRSFFKKVFVKFYKKAKKKIRKIRRIRKKNLDKKSFLSFKRNYKLPKKSSNINILLLRLINRQKIDRSKKCTKKSLYDFLSHNYSAFDEELEELYFLDSFITRYSKKINFKNLSDDDVENFRDKNSFFNAKRKLFFKIGNLLFVENLNSVLKLRYNFNSLIKLQKNLKKYKKKYYSKKKQKFGILRYNSGFSDRLKIELRRCINSFLYLKKGNRFLNYIKIKNFFKRFSRIGRKKKTKWYYCNYKKYVITKMLRKSSIFRKEKILSYYKVKRYSRRSYKSTFWFFKNKIYLKKFFKFFKIKVFRHIADVKNNKTRFINNLNEKRQLTKCSVYSEFLKNKQSNIFYTDFVEEEERRLNAKNFSTEFMVNSIQNRLDSLIREYNMVKNFAEDPGLKMFLFKKYKKNSVNSILNDIKKNIKNLERSKGKHNVYEKQKFSSRKFRRRLWYNAKKTIKESKNPNAVFRAQTELFFLQDLKLREEREQMYKRIRIFKSVKYLFNKTKKFKFFYLKNYYVNKMFILNNSYNKIGVKTKSLNFLNLENYFLENYFFKKKSYRLLDNSFFYLKKELILLDYFKDINTLKKKNNYNINFFFSKDIFISSFSDNFKYINSKFFYKNKFWINLIWNFYFSVKKSFYNRYFIKFFKKIYKLKVILLNFISNFCFINNTKIYFFIFKKKFIPSVTSFLNFFFYRINGMKVKYHVKKTLKLLEKYFRYKIFSGYKFCLSGRYSRKDRAEFNWVRDGLLPLTDKFSPVYYGFYFNSFRYGAVNVKFWILLKSLKRRNRRLLASKNSFLIHKISTKNVF